MKFNDIYNPTMKQVGDIIHYNNFMVKQEGEDYFVVYEKNPLQVPFYKIADATSKLAATKKAKLLQIGYNIAREDMN